MRNINIGQQANNVGAELIPTRRRSRQDIIAEILSIAQEGARPTRIMYKSNLNFERKERYLGSLLGARLLSVKVKSPLVYKTTKLGSEWLKNYRRVQSV